MWPEPVIVPGSSIYEFTGRAFDVNWRSRGAGGRRGPADPGTPSFLLPRCARRRTRCRALRMEHASCSCRDGADRGGRERGAQHRRRAAPRLGNCSSPRLILARRPSPRRPRQERSGRRATTCHARRETSRSARASRRRTELRVLAVPVRVSLPDGPVDTGTPPRVPTRPGGCADSPARGSDTYAATALRAEPRRRHEPIHGRDLRRDHDYAIELLGWIHPGAAAWAQDVTMLGTVLDARPSI